VDAQEAEEEGQLLTDVLLGPVAGTALHEAVEDVAQVALADRLK
jgi:hypothetical protein